MKKFLGIFAILMMIGACGALFSDSEIDEEVAEEESVHEEDEKEVEETEKVVAKEESEVEDEVDGDNSVKSDEDGSDKGDKDKEDISDVEEEEVQEGGNSKEIEVEEESEEEESEEEESEKEVASSDMLPMYENILVESFDGLAQVDYLEDSRMFTLLPLDPMFESELEAVVMGYGHDDFQYMVDSLQELSATGVELVGEGYSIALVNPANIENYIVVVTDGVVIYNALDDL